SGRKAAKKSKKHHRAAIVSQCFWGAVKGLMN
ncbi:MAG: hypothetical protein ACI87L_000590, partial [Litorivivens sp.]